jgi:hypothetical protein
MPSPSAIAVWVRPLAVADAPDARAREDLLLSHRPLSPFYRCPAAGCAKLLQDLHIYTAGSSKKDSKLLEYLND